MADNTTTIEVTDDQKQALDGLKNSDHEPYKSVIGRLIDGHSDGAIGTHNDTPEFPEVSTLEYDDVKNACAAALRDELPEGMH